MITLKFDHKQNVLEAFGRSIPATCDVRNELNGRRHEDQVVYTIPGKAAYQPRKFPKGLWKIGRPEPRTDKYLAPYFIPTDAWQEVTVWEIKNENDIEKYVRPTIRKEIDRAYGLHYSTSNTTSGCIRIGSEADLLWLVAQIKQFRDDGIDLFLEVV